MSLSEKSSEEKQAPTSTPSIQESQEGLPAVQDGKLEDPEIQRTVGESQYLSGLRLNLIAFGLLLAVLLVALDNAIIAVAIPTITTEFNSLDDVGWYGSAFLISTCALQPTSGKMFNSFSLKWTYLAFIAVFEIGSLLCGVAQSSDMLIVGRAVAGIGAAGLFSGAVVIISHVVAPAQRAIYTGIIASTFGVAGIFGPVLGGTLTQNASWRWCFYINLPIGAVTIVILTFVFNPKTRHISGRTFAEKIKSLDLPGVCLFIPAIIMILLAVQWGGNKYAWNSATIIGLFCGAAVLIVLFAIHQTWKGDEASIPPKIFLQRSVLSASIMAFLAMGSFQIFAYYLPLWFQVIKGISPQDSGIRILPQVLMSVFFSIASGAAVTKLGYYNPWLILGTILLPISGGLLSMLKVDSSSAQWIGYQIPGGSSAGMIIQMPLIAIMAVLPVESVSIGTSLVVFSQFFGGAIFLIIAQSIFSSGLVKALATNVPHIDPAAVVAVGAAGVRSIVSVEDLPGVLEAYNTAITHVFYITCAGGVLAFIATQAVEWRNVKGKSLA